MSLDPENAIRRSQRSRKPVDTVYDEARRHVYESPERNAQAAASTRIVRSATSQIQSQQKPSTSKQKQEKKKIDDLDENGSISQKNDDEAENSDADDSTMSSSSSDEDSDSEADPHDFQTQASGRGGRHQSPSKTKDDKHKLLDRDRVNTVPGQFESRVRRTKQETSTTNCNLRDKSNIIDSALAGSTSRRQLTNALMAVSKKVLHPEEIKNPRSLLACVLTLPAPNLKSRKNNSNDVNDLKSVAQMTAQSLSNDSNLGHIELLNFIFRSVGSRYENMFQTNIDLDQLSDDELSAFVQQVVDDMADNPADCALLCADPHGPATNATRTKLGMAGKEYGQLFQNFWYELGLAIITSTMSMDDTNEDGNHCVDTAKALITRLMDFAWIGVPGIRFAFSTAIYQLGKAFLHRTSLYHEKLSVAERQYQAAKRITSSTNSSRKLSALQQQVDQLRVSIVSIEDIVEKQIMGVFLKRYRDKNENIRATSLNSLSFFTLIRPDVFLSNSYCKYFGWMLSDRNAIVRKAAVLGLLEPFRALDSNAKPTQYGSVYSNINITKDNIDTISSVINKFLTRLADCVLDVDPIVQEVAMELLLHLVRNDYFDDIENDRIWHQINLRAISPNTTLAVRRNALYFVMEQLQQFDDGTSTSQNDAVERIKALVEWIAHVLSDGDTAVENIRFELTDLLVASLRTMPEHQALVQNWTAMLQVLKGDTRNATKRGGRKSLGKVEQRQDAIQQRIILRYFVASAELEVQLVADTNTNQSYFMSQDIDIDLLGIKKLESISNELNGIIKKGKGTASTSQEELTLTLMRTLPDLLVSFKSEISVLQNLTTLPRYLLPSVFNLPSRKKEFHSLVSNLSKAFLEATDGEVINNCALALVSLTRGDHARKDEALIVLRKTADSLKVRLFDLLRDRKTIERNADNDDDSVTLSSFTLRDTQNALCLCLRRLRVLSKRWYIPDLLSDSPDKDDLMHEIFSAVSDYCSDELSIRQLILSQESVDEIEVPKVWNSVDDEVHAIVATSISESLDVLLSLTAWRVSQLLESLETSPVVDANFHGADSEDHIVLQMRNQIVKLVVLCYEQFIESDHVDLVTKSQLDFSTALQVCAGRLTGDIRTLFPKCWSSAKSGLLASLALTQEVHLVGGLVRFVRSQEAKLREGNEGKDNSEAIRALLLPLARGLAGNWLNGNRKEAGVALSHIAGSGKEAHNLVQSLSRVCKKIHPVRLLESHMAYLRQDFNDWKASQPDELEDDRPSDEKLATFEREEKNHKLKFEAIENRASRLSASLGVGTIRDKTLAPALVGFVREGLRYAFSTDIEGSEETLLLGERLTFLSPLSKFLNWIRRNKSAKELIKNDINQREAELRNHPDYDEIYDEDKAAINAFRKSGELGVFPSTDDEGTNSGMNAQTRDAVGTTSSVNSLSKGSKSSKQGGGGSVSSASIRSKFSSSQSLSPLPEEEEIEELDDEHIPTTKRRDVHNMDESDEEMSQLSLSPKAKKRRKIALSSNKELSTMKESGNQANDSDADS